MQESAEKINRGDVLRESNTELIKFDIQKYFYFNEITKEKLSYIVEKLGKTYNITAFLKEYEKNISKI